jgi:hypothetical protein
MGALDGAGQGLVLTTKTPAEKHLDHPVEQFPIAGTCNPVPFIGIDDVGHRDTGDNNFSIGTIAGAGVLHAAIATTANPTRTRLMTTVNPHKKRGALRERPFIKSVGYCPCQLK